MKNYFFANLHYNHNVFYNELPPDEGRHVHDQDEIIYFLDGDAEYIVEDTVIRLKPRTLLYAPAGSFHFVNHHSLIHYERFCLHLNPKAFGLSSQETPRSYAYYYLNSNDFLDNLFTNLLRAEYDLHYDDYDMEQFVVSSIKSLLIYLKYLKTEKTLITNNKLSEIITCINKNITQPLSARIIAKELFISESNVHHTVSEKLGVTVKYLIDKKKVAYAKRLLREGLPPVKTAERCAYENYSTFYRTYLRFYGHSPLIDYVKPIK